ncbi:unnamed protein product [Boreogadus saida]
MEMVQVCWTETITRKGRPAIGSGPPCSQSQAPLYPVRTPPTPSGPPYPVGTIPTTPYPVRIPPYPIGMTPCTQSGRPPPPPPRGTSPPLPSQTKNVERSVAERCEVCRRRVMAGSLERTLMEKREQGQGCSRTC